MTVSGTFNKAPKVTIPKETGTGALLTKTVIQGTGAKLTSAEGMIGNYVAYDWSGKTSKLLGSSYTQGAPSIFVGSLLPGLETALVGQKLGSRVLAVIPPKDGFGTSGNSSEGIGASDTLVFVIDIGSTFTTGVGGSLGGLILIGGGSSGFFIGIGSVNSVSLCRVSMVFFAAAPMMMAQSASTTLRAMEVKSEDLL